MHFIKHYDALAESSSAISFGVVIASAPVTGIVCDNVNWISPLPVAYLAPNNLDLATRYPAITE
jgi:hypothetical protein